MAENVYGKSPTKIVCPIFMPARKIIIEEKYTSSKTKMDGNVQERFSQKTYVLSLGLTCNRQTPSDTKSKSKTPVINYRLGEGGI